MARTHLVTFYAPGAFLAEDFSFEVSEWSIGEALALVPKCGLKPYAFQFATNITADPVPDGEGGTLAVLPREVSKSGMHYLGGELLTYDQLRRDGDPHYVTMLSNMSGNRWPVVIRNRTHQPFNEEDCIVDNHGQVVRRGDDADLMSYRAEALAGFDQELVEFRTKWNLETAR